MSTKSVNFYELLEVDKTATIEQIKASYRKLALKFHPDKNPAGEERFKEIAKAYAILSDEKRRLLYDQYGEEVAEENNVDFYKIDDKQVYNAWLAFFIAWFLVLCVDYFLNIPLEWILALYFSGSVLWRLSFKMKAFAFVILGFFDLFFYLLTPSNKRALVANVILWTASLLRQNTFRKDVDFSVFVWLFLVGVDLWGRSLPNKWLILATHASSFGILAIANYILYFSTTYVYQPRPSHILNFGRTLFTKVYICVQFVAQRISLWPLLCPILFLPVYLIDFLFGIALEWLIFLGLSFAQMFFLIKNGKLLASVFSFAVCEILSWIIYFAIPTRVFSHFVNSVVYTWVLLVVHLFETVVPRQSNPNNPKVESHSSTGNNCSTFGNEKAPFLPLKLSYLCTLVALLTNDYFVRTLYFAKWYKLGAHVVGFTVLFVPVYIGFFDDFKEITGNDDKNGKAKRWSSENEEPETIKNQVSSNVAPSTTSRSPSMTRTLPLKQKRKSKKNKVQPSPSQEISHLISNKGQTHEDNNSKEQLTFNTECVSSVGQSERNAHPPSSGGQYLPSHQPPRKKVRWQRQPPAISPLPTSVNISSSLNFPHHSLQSNGIHTQGTEGLRPSNGSTQNLSNPSVLNPCLLQEKPHQHSSSMTKHCETCKKTEDTLGFHALKLCNGCRKVYYCSRKCQRIDWKLRHSSICQFNSVVLGIIFYSSDLYWLS